MRLGTAVFQGGAKVAHNLGLSADANYLRLMSYSLARYNQRVIAKHNIPVPTPSNTGLDDIGLDTLTVTSAPKLSLSYFQLQNYTSITVLSPASTASVT